MIEEEDKQEELLPGIPLQAQEQVQEDNPVEHLAVLDIVPQNQIHIEVFEDNGMSSDPES